MKKSDVFLSYYNKIRKVLQQQSGLLKEYDFPSIINEVSKSSAIVRYYKKDIQELSDLRNAIVHEYKDGMVIAEPNEEALNLIEEIYNAITKPPRILSIAHIKVEKAQIDDSLAKVVEIMDTKNYSQIPIYNGINFEGLLTENGITHWLGKNAKADIFSLEETKAGEVLKYEENPKNFRFFCRKKTVYEAIEVFNQNMKDPHSKIWAILVTENGKSSELPLGIVTIWNIAEFLSEMKSIVE